MSDQKRKYIILYLDDKVNELRLNHRTEILQMILYSSIEDSKVVEKGNGTQVKFSDIPNELLLSIYNFVHNKVENAEDII